MMRFQLVMRIVLFLLKMENYLMRFVKGMMTGNNFLIRLLMLSHCLEVIKIMLFKLSVKNFKKSIKDYSIYFFTLILGVAVFYMFNAIGTQAAMMEVSKTKEDIIATMNGVLSGMSILVALILGYLIVYASHFM